MDRSTDADLSNIEDNYLKRGGLFQLVEDDQGHLVGTIGLYPVDFSECEIRKMYVRKDCRGSGLGVKLARYAVAEAKRLGFLRARLETASSLVAAIHIGEKLGFQDSGETPDSPRCDRVYSLDLE